jgi:hypothetical protein
MSAREELDRLEKWGVMIPASSLRQIVEDLLSEGGAEWGGTDYVASVVGMSADFWQDRAREGSIKGAFQRTEGGPWVLPLAECRAHLARESTRKANAPPKKTRRGPWRKAS